MKKQIKTWKNGWILIAFTGIFLCGLLGLHFHDRAALAKTGVETERVLSEDDPRIKPDKTDLNTAEQAELETLPGIGPELARRIISYREENGPFETAEELLKVSGIGEKKLAGLDGYIMVNGGEDP